MLLRDTCILSVCACPYVCVNVCGCDCVFARPQCKYLILCLYCVAVCHSASHATINTRGGGGQASLNSSSVCWKTSRYHWQAQGWEINIYSKLPQITSRDFSPCLFLSVLSSSLLLGFRPSLCLLWAFFKLLFFPVFSVISCSSPVHCFTYPLLPKHSTVG